MYKADIREVKNLENADLLYMAERLKDVIATDSQKDYIQIVLNNR